MYMCASISQTPDEKWVVIQFTSSSRLIQPQLTATYRI